MNYGTVGVDPDIINPKMTAYNAPSPCVVTESNYSDTSRGWVAFSQGGGQTVWYYNSTAAPQWIKFDFGSGNAKVANRYNMFTASNNWQYPGMPTAWTLEGSNDDSNWTTLDSVSGYEGWGQNYGTGNFGASFFFNNTTAYRYYRWTFTAKQSSVYGWQICEIELIYSATRKGYVRDANAVSPIMTSATTPSPYVVTEDTYTAPGPGWKVFDGKDVSNWYLYPPGDHEDTHWIKIDMGSAILVNGYSLTSNPNVSLYAGMPMEWTLYGSNNDVDWTQLDSRSMNVPLLAWQNAEMRRFNFANTTSYRYYRLDFTDEYGAPLQYFGWQIDEFELIYPFVGESGFWPVLMRLLDQQRSEG